MLDPNNKIALVTGASRGIGRAIALALGQAGGTVIGTATTADGAKQIDAALKEANIPGAGITLNLTSRESIEEMMSFMKEVSLL